ncbi:hypothetical protein GYMLUDRAFT_253173 [Collybiopsis luxurians FD-317 M1]|uniref:Uncharacterized protein n=1 Tax=Collybiopsis luxurians FD-317 M1 TaxID=944289 RepID=A0A0D0BXL8_9AGAR|nr:hypothetical protein GYMLUDRAFT_253173 [Collybiopsis luxurians FD-317 M1]
MSSKTTPEKNLADIRADILLLSSYFRDAEVPGLGAEHTKDDLDSAVVNAAASLLCTGTKKSPHADVVNAVALTIEGSKPLLTFTENIRITSDGSPFEETPITPDPSKAAALLDNWSEDLCDHTYTSHLEDVVNAISLFSSLEVPRSGYGAKFVFFIHRRAFRKLALRTRDFTLRWGGVLPFKTARLELGTIQQTMAPMTFKIELEPTVMSVVNHARITSEALGKNWFMFNLSATTIERWLDLFEYIWRQLEDMLLNERTDESKLPKPRESPPSLFQTQVAVLSIECLRALRPVLLHIFTSYETLISRLHQNEMSTIYKKVRTKFEGFKFPSQENKVEGEGEAKDKDKDEGEVQDEGEGGSDAKDKVEGEGKSEAKDMGEDEDEDKDEDKDEGEPEFRRQRNENSGSRVIRFLDTITAWFVSCTTVWKAATMAERRYFDDMAYRRITIGVPPSYIPYHSADNVVSILKDLLGETCEVSSSRTHGLAGFASRACIHAEAALMALLYNKKMHISVTKKCCFMCWVLYLVLTNLDNPIIFAFGAHGVLYPWIAPPGLPDQVYRDIYEWLLEACQQHVIGGHSRHSSGAGSEVSDGKGVMEEESYDKQTLDNYVLNK